MRLLVDAVYTTIKFHYDDQSLGYRYLTELLTVDLDPDGTRTQYLRRMGHYYVPRYECFLQQYKDASGEHTRFATGLLGFVLKSLHSQNYKVDLVWLPGAAKLPIAVAAKQLRMPEGLHVRDYQIDLVTEAATKGRGVIKAATAAGKTAIMGLLLQSLGNPPSLILVGNRSLVRQTKVEVSKWLCAPVGEFSSSEIDLAPNCVVGMVQSVAAHFDSPVAQALLATRKVLLLDEVHHLAVDSKRTKKGKLKGGFWHGLTMSCPAPNRYGLSATPLKLGEPAQNWRLVGATGPLLDRSISSSALIDDGYAARPYCIFLPFKSRIIASSKTYREVVNEGIIHCDARNQLIVDSALTLASKGLKTMVLIEHVEHGDLLYSMLRVQAPYDLQVDYINGKLNQAQQEDKLAWLKEDGARVIITTRVLGEGTNVPDIGAVVYAKGGKALVQLFQAIGRGQRPKGGDGGFCIVVIPADNHNKRYLAKHNKLLRTHLASEPAYRIAEGKQSLEWFIDSVVEGRAATDAKAEDDTDEETSTGESAG